MIILAELIVSLIRILLLVFAIILSYFLGQSLYNAINQFLFAFDMPCLSLISALVAAAIPVALLYGIHIRKHFFQRQNTYNMIILFLSFALGALLVLSPLTFVSFLGATAECTTHRETPLLIGQIISTGIITAFLAFVGVDFGVLLKQVSTKINSSHPKITKNKKRR